VLFLLFVVFASFNYLLSALISSQGNEKAKALILGPNLDSKQAFVATNV
jgi:hypothetical protein